MADEIIYVTVTAAEVEVVEVEVDTPEPIIVNVVVNEPNEPKLPFGVAVPFFGTTAPTKHAFPIGQLLSRELYPELAAEIAADDTTEFWVDADTFSLPDLRDKTLVGKGIQAWASTLNQTGGSPDAVVVSHGHSDTLAAPAHTHQIDPPNTGTTGDTHSHGSVLITSGSSQVVTGPGFSVAVGSTAGDTHSHNVNIAEFGSGGASATALTGSITAFGVSGTNANLPPYRVCNYIMRLL